MPTAEPPLVALSRPLPGNFHIADARIKIGPERGFAERAELLEFIAGAAAFVSWVTERIDEEFLSAAGPQLRIVANFAVGFDNIDVEACRRHQVIAANAPDAVTEGTADCAWALLLAAARRLTEADRFVRCGAWAEHGVLGPNEMLGLPISGKTLLIVGAGRIGYATALRSLGWGMKILYCARSSKPSFEHAPLCAQRVELEEGLPQADFVSIHTPLTPQTHHLINAARLALLKPTAVLVNTARGQVVDEQALAAALADKTIFAAGLDVFENEPNVHPALRGLDNVVMTPHFGSGSSQSRAQMTQLCQAKVEAVLQGRPPLTPIT